MRAQGEYTAAGGRPGLGSFCRFGPILRALASPSKYLAHYSEGLRAQVQGLIDDGRLGEVLARRYPERHEIQSNAALYEFAMGIKRAKMSQSKPLSKVRYCDKISTLNHALGLHTYATRVQGAKLKTKHELRVASVFKQGPLAFLEMIVVHELAHLRERDHDKAFYRLCEHMLPEYHQVEFDMRMWLTWRELEGKPVRERKPKKAKKAKPE